MRGLMFVCLASFFLASRFAYADPKEAAPPQATAQSPTVARAPTGPHRVNGTIVSFDGKSLTVRTDTGETISAAVLPTSVVLFEEPRTMADIHRGDFVGSAALSGTDGKLHAQEVRIFPESLRGMGEGQYPMGDSTNRSMTNATVSEVTAVSPMSGMLKLEFHGAASAANGTCTGRAVGDGTGCTGETVVQVAPGIPILAYVTGDASALVPNAAVSALFAPGPDGGWIASRLLVEHKGMKPV